jgi:hypothetical protein
MGLAARARLGRPHVNDSKLLLLLFITAVPNTVYFVVPCISGCLRIRYSDKAVRGNDFVLCSNVQALPLLLSDLLLFITMDSSKFRGISEIVYLETFEDLGFWV